MAANSSIAFLARRRRPSTLTWHPDRDVLYVTYASSLNVTVIDWDEYMGAPRLPAAPFLKARGVRPVPNRAHLNFTEDTVTSLAVLPAEKKGRFRMLIIGTAKGQVRACLKRGTHTKATFLTPARRRCCATVPRRIRARGRR